MKTVFQIVIIIFLNLFCWSLSLSSQSLQIEKITLENVVKNDENYLQYFIQSKVGDALNLNQLEADVQQLNRRTGIVKTNYEIDTINKNSASVRFIITEQKTLLPQFGLGGIENNFWWQVGFAEFNLRGREQVLLAYYLLNDERSNFKVYYQNGRIKGSPWGFATSLNHFSSVEPLYFPEAAVLYTYSNTGAGLTGIRYLDYYHSLSWGGDFFQEKYQKISDDSPSLPGPSSLQLNKLLLRTDFVTDKIEYDYFYRNKHYYNLKLQYVLTFLDNSHFVSLAFEGKKYWRPIPSGNVALRVRAAIATNTDSPFAPFVLDSRVNIRGVGNRVDRGTAQFVINLEYRQTVFHKTKWAGQAVVFSDMGTWRNPGGSFKELIERDQFRHFIGGGVRVINKRILSLVLRLDYGFDLWNPEQKGFVLGLDQYF